MPTLNIKPIKKIDRLITEEGVFYAYDIEKTAPRKRPVFFTVHENPDGWVIRNVVLPEEMRRKGIATRFYKRMNKASIKATGNSLQSSRPRYLRDGKKLIELTDLGVKLWESFVEKGLAIKTGERQYNFKQ